MSHGDVPALSHLDLEVNGLGTKVIRRFFEITIGTDAFYLREIRGSEQKSTFSVVLVHVPNGGGGLASSHPGINYGYSIYIIIAFLSVIYGMGIQRTRYSYQLLESRSQNLAVKVEDFAVFSLSLFLLKNCFFSYTLLIYYYREGVKSAVIPTLFFNLGLAQTQNFIFCPEKFGKLGFLIFGF